MINTKHNFWSTLKKPFLIQAPLEDVTDVVFREIISQCGKPDVFFTEFTSTDGLLSKGREKLIHKLDYTENQRPIVAQIWGNDPKKYSVLAEQLKEMKFDGVDINMGCPERSIVKRGCCSGLIKNPKLAQEIIQSTVEHAGGLPVSVKTRLGYDKFVTDEWVSALLETNIQALTLHGRIATRMSKDPANWEEIGKAVEIRNKKNSPTLIIGNGDVRSYEEALEKHKNYGVDGIMIGRGIFHNLWVFDKSENAHMKTQKEKLEVLIRHIKLWQATWDGSKNFDSLKKFYKMYISESENASHLRTGLMQLHTPEETLSYLEKYITDVKI